MVFSTLCCDLQVRPAFVGPTIQLLIVVFWLPGVVRVVAASTGERIQSNEEKILHQIQATNKTREITKMPGRLGSSKTKAAHDPQDCSSLNPSKTAILGTPTNADMGHPVVEVRPQPMLRQAVNRSPDGVLFNSTDTSNSIGHPLSIRSGGSFNSNPNHNVTT